MQKRFRATPSGEGSAELFERRWDSYSYPTRRILCCQKLRSPTAAGERFGFIPKIHIIWRFGVKV